MKNQLLKQDIEHRLTNLVNARQNIAIVVDFSAKTWFLVCIHIMYTHSTHLKPSQADDAASDLTS